MSRSIVVISCLNPSAAHLKACLVSVKVQTRAPDEILIINDGTDEEYLRNILDTVDLDYTYWSYERTMGLAYALNDSLSYARKNGFEYYFRMDADDIMAPTRIAVQTAFMTYNSNVDIVGSNARIINSVGLLTGGRIRKYTNHEALSQLMLFETPFVHPSICIRLKEYHWKYEDWSHSQDYATWMKQRKSLVYANIDQFLIKYRIGHSSISKRNSITLDGKYPLMRELIKSVFPTWTETKIYRHYLWTNKDRLIQAKPGFTSFLFWSYDIVSTKGISKIIIYQLLKRLYWLTKL